MKAHYTKRFAFILAIILMLFLISACSAETPTEGVVEKDESLCINTLVPVPLDQVQCIYVSKDISYLDDDGGKGTVGLWTCVSEETTIKHLHSLLQTASLHIDSSEDLRAGEIPIYRYVIYVLSTGDTVKLQFDREHLITLAGTTYVVEAGAEYLTQANSSVSPYMYGNIDAILKDHIYTELDIGEALCVNTLVSVPLDQVERIYVSKEVFYRINEDGIHAACLWTSVSEKATMEQLHNLIQSTPLPEAPPEDYPAGGSPRYIIYVLSSGESVTLCFSDNRYPSRRDAFQKNFSTTVYQRIDQILQGHSYTEHPDMFDDTFTFVSLDQIQSIYVSELVSDTISEEEISNMIAEGNVDDGVWTCFSETSTITYLFDLMQNRSTSTDMQEEIPEVEEYKLRYFVYVLTDGETVIQIFREGLYITLAAAGDWVELDANAAVYWGTHFDEILSDYTYKIP